MILLGMVLLTDTHARSECLPAMSREDLRQIVDEVRTAHFPELAGKTLPFVDCTSKSYFFQASIQKSALLLAKKKYFLEVNKLLLDCPPTRDGLRAIVTHELTHFQDYERMSVGSVIKLGARYSSNKSYRRNYERETDLHALALGEGRGLIEYREWLYARLSPKDLFLKRYYYLTPEEILEILGAR